ncbi:hypothetical protein ACFJIX_22175 [Roseateles sp. UC29_93]|uniref:hypothetical protein n=1 Tax=Roseateles sp. UC29_93 TaxID=3350177 RepID=UPI00366FE8D5
MPSFQKPSPGTGQIDPYDHTSMEVEGYEVTVGLNDGCELDEHQLKFVDRLVERIDERAKTTKTAFSAHFEPRRLIERHLLSKDPAFRAMCMRGIDLLRVNRDADDGAVALAARRTADAAEVFLDSSEARDPRLRKFGLEVRLRARETMQERIQREPQQRGEATAITARSDAFVLVTRERARLMAEFLGVHRTPDVPGVDFILDAHGKVAYAFKPMAASAAVQSVCMSRLHAAMFPALGYRKDATPSSTAMIVSMPARPAPPTGDVDDVDEALGLLMMPPPGFELCLDSPGEGRDVGRQRLADALARPLNDLAFDHLALSALCAGGQGLRLDGVLVDERGRAWVLDHEHLLADRHAGLDSTAVGTGQGRASPTEGRIPADLPMRPGRLHALGQLDVPQLTRRLAATWQATDRERRLLGEALGKTSKADIAATDRLWPDPAAVAHLKDRLEVVQHWAASCDRSNDELLATEDATEVEDLSDALSQQSSIRWLLSRVARDDVGSRPGDRADA